MTGFKRVYIFLFIIAVFGSISAAPFAQNETVLTPDDVVHCETLADVEKAKSDGVIFFEFRNTFWVLVGSNYKGPFRYLSSAQKIYNQYKLDAINKPAPKSPAAAKTPPSNQKPTSFYNPELIVFPFIEYGPDNRIGFSVPNNLVVAASHVMIHPEPLEFDNISFGMIDLNLFAKKLFASPGMQANSPPDPKKLQDKYFTVTGSFTARENVIMPTAPLDYWVGAAVVGAEGSILWRNYGQVEKDQTFKCISLIPETNIQPEFLLLFILAKGKLDVNIRPKPEFPVMDASPYDYHILGSSNFEMGPNWLPPIQAAAKQEYQEMLNSMKRQKLQEMRSSSAPPSSNP
ncbi:MAG: hypothetical protein JXR73_02975 [Candidatus Omnitrophica bacterium]|nr:hypothetical protein [Candidatus Omnitrophota bacterium]